MPLVINSLRGNTNTRKHTYIHMSTQKKISRNQAPACTWFNNVQDLLSIKHPIMYVHIVCSCFVYRMAQMFDGENFDEFDEST